jgi:hypothetical protein
MNLIGKMEETGNLENFDLKESGINENGHWGLI